MLKSARLETSLPGEADAFYGSGICEPANTVSAAFVDQRTRKSVAALEDLLHNALLSGACGYERDLDTVTNNWECESDSLGRWLWGILDWSYPCVCLSQERVTREETASMPIWSAS